MDQWQDHQTFMKEVLTKAATHFHVRLCGNPVFGWHDRSIGSQVKGDDEHYWLRVLTEMKHWIQGDWWEGNTSANAITGIAKTSTIDVYEWEHGEMQIRAELMTFALGQVCSNTPELRTYLDLPNSWWSDLRISIDRLSAWSTKRVNTEQSTITRRFLVFYGDDLDSKVTHWMTAHGDLHWANLMAPQLTILDWEGWGRAPAGLDAATLYCYSLLIPEMAERVYNTFEDILDTPEGIRAQLYVITRLLHRIDQGDYPDLAGPLHRHVRKLLSWLK